MRIGVTEIFVDDQDTARAFYTEVLGFEVKMDASATVPIEGRALFSAQRGLDREADRAPR